MMRKLCSSLVSRFSFKKIDNPSHIDMYCVRMSFFPLYCSTSYFYGILAVIYANFTACDIYLFKIILHNYIKICFENNDQFAICCRVVLILTKESVVQTKNLAM